jgi:hypothetical protein
MAANGLCMSSGICTRFQINTNLSVPLLIHGVSTSTVCLVKKLNLEYLYIKEKTNGIEKIYSDYY